MMPTPITPDERYHILRRVYSHVVHLLANAARDVGRTDAGDNVDHQFVRESIADACHAIDAAVADVPTEEEIEQS